jgi:hypothetical protein
MAVLGASSLQIDSATLGPISGSAPMYACRAWVNFNGTTSPGTIRASGNVSSTTRQSTGRFTVNLSTALSDANYEVNVTSKEDLSGAGGSGAFGQLQRKSQTSSSVEVSCVSDNNIFIDAIQMNVIIFR